MRWMISLVVFLLPGLLRAQEMEPAPKSAADSLKCIQVRPGFKVELLAAEPIVQSPIAFAWGPDGKFWVVEMGDYPLGVDGKGKPGGRIKILSKSREDGPYDQAKLFLDGLSFPTSVLPYKNGVLVTCAPDIFFAEEKNGKVEKEILFTGFREGNPQHRVNGLCWGLDGWVYGANGDSGGFIESITKKTRTEIRGRDFRFKPDTGVFDVQTGQSQFGRAMDDWGNWFGNNNTNPLYHYVLDDNYMRRNPSFLSPNPKIPVSEDPGASRVYPISKPLPRFNTPAGLNHFTSACSTIFYRDTLFGPEFEGNSFVSEPVHNLIHREIVKRKGLTFTSRRADDEKTSEFLASSDNWFRPTTIQTGPDGALWVADMYRYVIEHPEWIPKDWQKKLDLRAGHDKGRIYRIYPTDKKLRTIPRLDKLSRLELVKMLESPNGWVRDNAQVLLIELNDTDTFKIKEPVLDLIEKSKDPKARIHAMYYWDEKQVWDKLTLVILSNDENPIIVRASLRFWRDPESFANEFDRLLKNPDPIVQQQLAYRVGEIDTNHPFKLALRLLNQKNLDPYIVASAMSSLKIDKSNIKEFEKALTQIDQVSISSLRLVISTADLIDAGVLAMTLLDYVKTNVGKEEEEPLVALGLVFDALDRKNLEIKDVLPERQKQDALTLLSKQYQQARTRLADAKTPLGDRIRAVGILLRGLGVDREDRTLLASLLTPHSPDDLQIAIVDSLGRRTDPRIPELLLKPWKGYSPVVRQRVLDVMLSQTNWSKDLLAAVDYKKIPAREISTISRERLLKSSDKEIKSRALKLLTAASNPDRNRVVTDYWLRLPESGEAMRGSKLFTKSCAACHKFGSEGQVVGPDLASLGDKTPQGLLTAILDPNRTVEARYVSYTVTTKAGKILHGMIQSETSTTLTLVGPDGKTIPLLRNEVEEMASSGTSLMPEGLERDLSPQNLADLIEFIRSDPNTRSKD